MSYDGERGYVCVFVQREFVVSLSQFGERGTPRQRQGLLIGGSLGLRFLKAVQSERRPRYSSCAGRLRQFSSRRLSSPLAGRRHDNEKRKVIWRE